MYSKNMYFKNQQKTGRCVHTPCTSLGFHTRRVTLGFGTPVLGVGIGVGIAFESRDRCRDSFRAGGNVDKYYCCVLSFFLANLFITVPR